jgi:hypothetical protein
MGPVACMTQCAYFNVGQVGIEGSEKYAQCKNINIGELVK